MFLFLFTWVSAVKQIKSTEEPPYCPTFEPYTASNWVADESDIEFLSYMEKYDKHYPNPYEYQMRKGQY